MKKIVLSLILFLALSLVVACSLLRSERKVVAAPEVELYNENGKQILNWIHGNFNNEFEFDKEWKLVGFTRYSDFSDTELRTVKEVFVIQETPMNEKRIYREIPVTTFFVEDEEGCMVESTVKNSGREVTVGRDDPEIVHLERVVIPQLKCKVGLVNGGCDPTKPINLIP
jgi:hypothetical protein